MLAPWAMIVAGCDRDRPPVRDTATASSNPTWFAEESRLRGLQFTHVSGHQDIYYIPEVVVGGAALFDYDNDGDLDAYLVQSGSLTKPPSQRPGNQLFRNRGDGTFEDVTARSGTGDPGYGMGVTAGDYNNDGLTDLYVTNVGPNVLLKNNGDGTFSDVSKAAGVDHPGWGASAAFFDMEADGDLDLFFANYLNWSIETERQCTSRAGRPDYCGPNTYEAPAVAVLYRNEGDGTFTDISIAAGLPTAFGNGLGVVTADFNADHRVDVFVANDQMPNQLWINMGDGTFRDHAALTGCAVDDDGNPKAGMGVTAADIDNDGDRDLLIVNLVRESDSFHRNQGQYFVDDTIRVGLGVASRPFTRFGMGLHDFDHDGRLDLFEANGRVERGAVLHSEDPYAEPNLLFRGGEDGRFVEVLPRGGTADPLVFSSRAAAFGDVNNDGAIDILIVNRDAPASLLINAVPDRGHWIICRVVDEHGRDALNATVTMTVGDTRIMRDVMVAYSYCAANDPRVHIGLGRNEVATGVEVQWIDGTVEKFGDLSCDQIHVLRRGESHGRRSSPKSASGEIRANRRDRADEEQQPDHGDDGLRSAEFSTDE
jgi:hypothetical protein